MSVERDFDVVLPMDESGPVPRALRDAVARRRRGIRARQAGAAACVLVLASVVGWMVLPSGRASLPSVPAAPGPGFAQAPSQPSEHSVWVLQLGGTEPSEIPDRRSVVGDRPRPTVLGLRLSEMRAYLSPAS